MHSTADVSGAQRESDLVYSLRQRVHELEGLLGLRWFEPRVLRLTAVERRILGMLVAKRQPITQSRLHEALYGERDDPPLLETVRMHICHLRAKLEPFHIKIVTLRSDGYLIDADNLERLNALYAPGEQPTETAP